MFDKTRNKLTEKDLSTIDYNSWQLTFLRSTNRLFVAAVIETNRFWTCYMSLVIKAQNGPSVGIAQFGLTTKDHTVCRGASQAEIVLSTPTSVWGAVWHKFSPWKGERRGSERTSVYLQFLSLHKPCNKLRNNEHVWNTYSRLTPESSIKRTTTCPWFGTIFKPSETHHETTDKINYCERTGNKAQVRNGQRFRI